MINVQKHLDTLGFLAVDRVTGFRGVITSISFDLYGCIQAIVNPGLDSDGKLGDPLWFDVGRLKVESNLPVMDRPNFDWTDDDIASGRKGPENKPAMNKV